jgi:hypothetical protein
LHLVSTSRPLAFEKFERLSLFTLGRKSDIANAIVTFVCFTGIETKYIAKYTGTKAKNVTLDAKIAINLKER